MACLWPFLVSAEVSEAAAEETGYLGNVSGVLVSLLLSRDFKVSLGANGESQKTPVAREGGQHAADAAVQSVRAGAHCYAVLATTLRVRASSLPVQRMSRIVAMIIPYLRPTLSQT